MHQRRFKADGAKGCGASVEGTEKDLLHSPKYSIAVLLSTVKMEVFLGFRQQVLRI